MKKISKNILIYLIVINFLLPIGIVLNGSDIKIKEKTVYGAENWYYTVSQKNGERTETGGYLSKALCLSALKKVDPSWDPSKECYLGKNDLKINSFSPKEGKPGDIITITGENFIGIKSISLNNKEIANNLISVDNSNKIKILGFPSGFTTGKFIIKSENHGSSTSSENFNVYSGNDMKWWYYNNVGQVMGPGRREAVGFNDFNSCEIARKKFITDSGAVSMELNPCFQETISKIKEIIAIEISKTDYNEIELNKETPKKSSVYNLLAPIGDFTKLDSSDNIGSYFNIILKMAIGLCAVLAVVMIVIGGIQYMGNESIFGKTEAKGRIFKSILGLLIAIGSYALLNTINPALLGTNGLNISQVSAEIDEETESTPWEGSSSGDNTALCPGGFSNISVPWGVGSKKNLNVCAEIKPQVVNMLNAAKNAGIILSGSGSRTKAEQQSLRVKHGCPDPSVSSSKCTPPTARPGHSMHESGKAIDFRCNDQKMTSSSECFKWLSKNATTYGFKNLKSEPWHWSTTGR